MPMDLPSQTLPGGSGAHPDGRHDFDFLHGRWLLRNERLKQPVGGGNEWEYFASTLECQPVLGGLGNIDSFRAPGVASFQGMTLRLFNPGTRQWSLHWADNRTGTLDPPLTGRFEGGVGTFTGGGNHHGRQVLMRSTWTPISTHNVHWQQARSIDDGASWETTWDVWLRRIDADDRLIHDDAVIELRQYTLHPGARDVLIDLFEDEFIEPQEAVGMHVIGQFRDLDAPDRFVWLRGFPSMPARQAALQSFYFGRVWQQHRNAANATMIDSDNVLLLKPARPDSGIGPIQHARAPHGSSQQSASAFCLGILALESQEEASVGARFDEVLAPLLRAAGAEVIAYYVTDASENTFPRLPVRNERVLVWLARFVDVAALDQHLAALDRGDGWKDAVAALRVGLRAPPEFRRLAPTARSELR